MTICKLKPALFAGLAVLASAVVAAEHDLPNPSPSEFVDAESSVNVPLPTDEGRRIRLTLAFASTPSNAVQVAFGNDLNGSENLEPEETELVLGVDCGEPFVRNEVKVRGEGEQWNAHISFSETEQESNLDCSPSPSSFTFAFKQPAAVINRLTHAKVTTHNLADTNLVVTAEFYNRGQVLFLR